MTERSSPPGVNRSRRFQIYLCKTNGDGHKEKKKSIEKVKIHCSTQLLENMFFLSVKAVPSKVISQVDEYLF